MDIVTGLILQLFMLLYIAAKFNSSVSKPVWAQFVTATVTNGKDLATPSLASPTLVAYDLTTLIINSSTLQPPTEFIDSTTNTSFVIIVPLAGGVIILISTVTVMDCVMVLFRNGRKNSNSSTDVQPQNQGITELQD